MAQRRVSNKQHFRLREDRQAERERNIAKEAVFPPADRLASQLADSVNNLNFSNRRNLATTTSASIECLVALAQTTPEHSL